MGCQKLIYKPVLGIYSSKKSKRRNGMYIYNYRFSFNGQEKDDEVAGEGNINTAMYWEYDTRLGRRWNMDPIVKHHLSIYQSFNNNPIIYVDPLGNTDYYNKEGNWIASDGVKNNIKKMVFSIETEQAVIEYTNTSKGLTMNEQKFDDILEVPSKIEIQRVEEAYNESEITGKENGTIISTNLGKSKEIARDAEPGSEEFINMSKPKQEAINKGEIITREIHSHNTTDNETSNVYSNTDPSKNDIDRRKELENFDFGSGDLKPSIIVGDEYDRDDKTNTKKVVRFYTSDKTIGMTTIDALKKASINTPPPSKP